MPAAQEWVGVIIPQRVDRIAYLARMKLAELRKRQTMIQEQISRASTSKNTTALERLQLMYDEHSDAINLKYFGDYPGYSAKGESNVS